MVKVGQIYSVELRVTGNIALADHVLDWCLDLSWADRVDVAEPETKQTIAFL